MEFKAQLAQASQEVQALAEANQGLGLSLEEADYLVQHQAEQLEVLMMRLALSLTELERLQQSAAAAS